MVRGRDQASIAAGAFMLRAVAKSLKLRMGVTR